MVVFTSTVEEEDYLMGEYQQKASENGLLTEVIFPRNESPLHRFSSDFPRKAWAVSLRKDRSVAIFSL